MNFATNGVRDAKDGGKYRIISPAMFLKYHEPECSGSIAYQNREQTSGLLPISHLMGDFRIRLASRMTITSATARMIMAGRPISSKKPVDGIPSNPGVLWALK
jgi:hypothetical protein